MNLFSFDSLERLLQQIGFEVVVQRSLVAPIVWTFSLRGYFGRTKQRRYGWPARFFSDRNLFCLAAFSLLDALAIAAGFTTSNQKTIARKIPVDNQNG